MVQYMEATNETYLQVLTLLGFPKGQIVFPFLIASTYIMTVLGNLTVFTIIQVDSHLKSPMYFFLSCLSLLDICFSSVTLPAMLANAITGNIKISFNRCLVQLYFFVFFAGTECLFLAIMAYDRYVAICIPLHYTTNMNNKICSNLVVGCWLCGVVNAAFHTLMTWKRIICTKPHINHYFCDVPPLLRVTCTVVPGSQVILPIFSIIFGMAPLMLIAISYIFIISAILKIRSTEGRRKVFSTCSSHLIVVMVLYLTGVVNYNGPKTGDSFNIVRVSSLLYGIVPPLLNPIIYCLRNNEVKRALRAALAKLYISLK